MVSTDFLVMFMCTKTDLVDSVPPWKYKNPDIHVRTWAGNGKVKGEEGIEGIQKISKK